MVIEMKKGSILFALAAIGCTVIFLLGMYLMMPMPQENVEEEGFFMRTPIEETSEPSWELTPGRIGGIISLLSFGIMAIVVFVGAIHLRQQATKELYRYYSEGRIDEEEFYRKLKKLMNDV